MNRLTPPRLPAAPARSGATLTEVLMSMLIMGLGITSVFTLFPLTIVRSVKATNLTNAALLAESVREGYVALKGQLALPPAKANKPPISRYSHPKDVLLNTAPAVPDAMIPDPFIGTFVVDPFGGASAVDYGASPGRFGEATPGAATGHAWGVLRVANGYVRDNMIAPDSWITVHEDQPASVANSSGRTVLTFPAGVDFTPDVSPTRSRVLVVSTDNRQSFSGQLHQTNPVPSANVLQLDRTLPKSLYDDSGPVVDNVGLVRLQNFELRYSYLLTLHRDPTGNTTGQIVVYFRRSFGDSELLYNVTAIDPAKRSHRITIDIAGGTASRPGVGDYVFGTWITTNPRSGQVYHHGRWYRLVSVEETGTTDQYRLTLDRPWDQPDNNAFAPRVMLPKGVVSVFDL